MEIRKTQLEDLKEIEQIYIYAREFMVRTNNPNQWAKRGWPPIELIKKDIAEQNSYVCTQNNKIVGTFYFIQGDHIDKTYNVIYDGKWSYDEPYGVIHRIATNGTKGVGTFCINWALSKCKYLRIDTHEENVVMKNLLKKLGFNTCGIIHIVEDNAPRIAFDKKL